MRKLFVTWLILLLCFISQAQFSVAFVAGPQINSVTPAFSLNNDPVPVQGSAKHRGINFGFISQAPLNKKQSLFFRTGLFYSAKGSQTIQRYDTSNVDLTNGRHYIKTLTRLRASYIDIPLNLLYTFPVKGQLRFLLGGGLQGSLFYNGSIDYTTTKAYKTDPDSAVKLEYREVFKNVNPAGLVNNRTLHFSANALTGFEFDRIFVTVGYSYGLSNFGSLDDRSFKYNTLSFNFGIFLGNRGASNVPVVRDQDQPPTHRQTEQPPALRDTASILVKPDRDGDGVPDEQDKCPGIAGMAKYNGCPIPDSDGDGVNDEEDLCPTVAGDKDNHGCSKITEEEQKKTEFAAKSLQFEIYSARISPVSYPLLNEVVEILKSNRTFKIRVEGHTSGLVTEPNTILSQKRADSVKDYFIKKGIARDRIISIGMGSSKHISKDGYIRNNPEDRRVELIIL